MNYISMLSFIRKKTICPYFAINDVTIQSRNGYFYNYLLYLILVKAHIEIVFQRIDGI